MEATEADPPEREKLADGESQPDTEEERYDADLGEGANRLGLGEVDIRWCVMPDYYPRDYLANDEWLVESVEYERVPPR